jgi:hypothetical protein
MVQDGWLAARQVTAWLRGLPEDERLLRTRALDLLGRRFFEEPERASLMATPERVNEVGTVIEDEWKRYEPLCRAMAGKEENADACAAAVKNLLSPRGGEGRGEGQHS